MEFFGFFAGFSGALGYVVVFAALLACGLGLPVPEDIILISGGYIAKDAGHSVWPMVVTGMLGILAGDSLTFYFGRRFGLPLAKRAPLDKVLSADRLARTDALFKKHGEKILVAARFMPGVRAVTYFSAGAMGVPYWKFLVFDGLAALVSAPLWVILGFAYGAVVVAWAKRFGWFVLALIVVGVIVWWVRRSQKQATPLVPVDDPSLPPLPPETPANVAVAPPESVARVEPPAS